MKPKIDPTQVLCTKRMTKISTEPAIWQMADECKTCARSQGIPVKDGQAWMMPPSIKPGAKCHKHVEVSK
jgi:hypothetical protein